MDSSRSSLWEAQGKAEHAAAARAVAAHFRDRAQALHRRFLGLSTAKWLESALRRNAALLNARLVGRFPQQRHRKVLSCHAVNTRAVLLLSCQKGVHMYQPSRISRIVVSPEPVPAAVDAERESDMQDFEQDELLRTLRLEDWFATSEPAYRSVLLARRFFSVPGSKAQDAGRMSDRRVSLTWSDHRQSDWTHPVSPDQEAP